MAIARSSLRRGLGIALILATMAACSPKTPEANPLDGLTAEQIYTKGELAFDGKGDAKANAKKALTYFQDVERLFPYTEWAKRAVIMQAFTLHKRKNYEESRVAAQRYIDFYPAGEDMAYAHYLVALSYYDQIDEVGRDQGLTFQSLQALRVVIEQYPDSEYAKSAMLKFDLAFDHLAAKEMEIGRYYLKKRQYSAALNRFRNVVQDYQTTAQTAEALERLVECYLALGMPDEAQTAGAILGYNYKSSPFYQDAFNLLKKQGLAPEAKGTGWLTTIYRQMIKGEWL